MKAAVYICIILNAQATHCYIAGITDSTAVVHKYLSRNAEKITRLIVLSGLHLQKSHYDREYKDPNDVLLESYRSLYIDIVSDLYVNAPIYQYQGTLLLVSTAK